MARPDWIEVGRIVRAHGVRGEVRVAPSTDNPERFVPGSRVFARRKGAAPGEGRPLIVEGVRGGDDLPIMSFGLTSREEAEELIGALLEVPGEELPELEEGEFYPFELEDLEARAADGSRVGVVRELLEGPANDVLVLRLDGGGEALLPFVHEVVPEVDLSGGFLVIDERYLPEHGEA